MAVKKLVILGSSSDSLSKLEEEIRQSRKELEKLADKQLILRSLASLVSHTMPREPYYQVMASVLRERAERKNE